jgi:hypothetical protein
MAQDIANKAAEFDRWNGVGLIPMRGYTFTRLPMGKASVLAEIETQDDRVLVQRVLINGCMVESEDWVHPDMLAAWESYLWEEHKAAGKLLVSVADLRRAA